MNKSEIFQYLYGSLIVPFNEYDLIKISGSDTRDYLQRQFTSDLLELSDGLGQLSARLDRGGRIKAYFYLGQRAEEYFLVTPKSYTEFLLDELDKFIIMEEITISKVSTGLFLNVGPIQNNENQDLILFKTKWCNQQATFLTERPKAGLEISINTRKDLTLATAWPELNLTLLGDELVNETILNELAVSYAKGCFLGQETVSKINSRRGASRYPSLLETDQDLEIEKLVIDGFERSKFWGKFFYEDKTYLLVSLPREARVVGRELQIGEHKVKVVGLTMFADIGTTAAAKKIYLNAVGLFHQKNYDQALELLDCAIKIDPSYGDAYESKGAILGQLGKYEDAIGLMDRLLEVDEHSVMAHTNKSLFYMKLGKIEEAEEEKALATVANFQRLGDEARIKKSIEEDKKKNQAAQDRRENMFLQVLKLDARDEIANYGLADILYSRGEAHDSLAHLEIVLLDNPKYSVAYLLMGKVLESLNKTSQAKTCYETGIDVATLKGDMMPANEMQSRLNSIKNNAS